MNDSASPFGYLDVIPPNAPLGNIRSQEITAVRLARHVAVLFGVDVPDNPAGRTWVADYERLRVNEIARGALSVDPKLGEPSADAADLDVIATATLQKYGPDNKAALVLSACEVLFGSVKPVFKDVLGIIGTSSDNESVANVTVFAAWSLLVSEMFRAQPALTAAALKSRAVQTVSHLEWRVVPTDLPLYPSERPRERDASADASTWPRELSVLDHSLPQDLMLLGSRYGKDARNDTLVETLVNSWCHYLLDSANQGAAWITNNPREPQSHSAVAFLPTMEPARTFISDVLAISPFLRPMTSELNPSLEPVPFLRSQQRDDGVTTSQGHTDRLLPRMYSTPEVAKLEPRSQRALLMTHMRILQLFRGSDDFSSSYLRAKSREDSKQIVQIARRLWGDTDPMTVMLGTTSAMFEHTDLRDSSGSSSLNRLYQVFVDSFAEIHAAWESGIVPDGVWISFVYEHSTEIRQAADHFAQHDGPAGDALRGLINGYWRAATRDTGIRNAWDLAFSNTDTPLPYSSMHGLFHNYLAIPFRSSDPQEVMNTLKFSLNKLLPLRKKVSAFRKRETPYRLTLQITVFPIYTLLARVDMSSEDRSWLVEKAGELEQQLRDTAKWRYFFSDAARDQRDLNQTDLNYLVALARSQVLLLEHWPLSKAPFDQVLRRAVITLKMAWNTYQALLEQESGYSGSPVAASSGARRFLDLTDVEMRFRTAVEGNARDLTPEMIDVVGLELSAMEAIRGAIEASPAPPQQDQAPRQR